MRLLTKNTIILLIVTLVIFTCGGFIFYNQLVNIMKEEAMEALQTKKEIIEEYIEEKKELPPAFSADGTIEFVKAEKEIVDQYNEVIIYNKIEKELLPYLQLKCSISLNDEIYTCSINKSMLESDDLIETIYNSLLIILVILVVLFVSINFIFSRLMWKPFFKILNRVKDFELDNNINNDRTKTGTREFKQLQDALDKMMDRISADYQNLKSFTENASHEIQTPLAIIKNKTEWLMQSSTISEAELKELSVIYQTINRISKLNQTLLLISKIENNQFKTNEIIDMKKLVKDKLELFEDLFRIKQMEVTSDLHECKLKLHPELADIIISNLLSNTIKHSSENAEVEVILNKDYLMVTNTGEALTGNKDQLFQRFYKENQTSESSGLGLALINQIAQINNNRIDYEYINNKHQFIYHFNS